MHVIVPKELNSTEFPGEDAGLCPTYYIIIMDLVFIFSPMQRIYLSWI